MKKLIYAVIIVLSVGRAQAQFTADQICDKITGSFNGVKKVGVFFDANDEDQKQAKMEFYTFKITTQIRLGDFFDGQKTVAGYTTSQNKIPYDFKQYDFGRLFTQFFGIPKPLVETKKEIKIDDNGNVTTPKDPAQTPKYWNIYQLCKQEKWMGHKIDSCRGTDMKIVGIGDWYLTTGLDHLLVHDTDAEVFAFLFERKFPKINCVN
jgi:hypothetical protein